MNGNSDKYVLTHLCTDSYAHSYVQALEDMYDAEREINFKTFSRHAAWKPVALDLGYVVGPGRKGLHLRNDYHVRYYRSKWRGEVCYYMDWSSIDHVFLRRGELIPNERGRLNI